MACSHREYEAVGPGRAKCLTCGAFAALGGEDPTWPVSDQDRLQGIIGESLGNARKRQGRRFGKPWWKRNKHIAT